MTALALLLLAPPTLSQRFAALEPASKGRLGVGVELLETGERFAFRGSERFPTQSVFKVPISMAVLAKGIPLARQVQISRAELVPILHSPLRDRFPNGTHVSVADLIRLAIEESDGTASDVLVGLAGGPGSVTAYLRSIGVRSFTVATSERGQLRSEHVQYRNWATPAGCLDLLRELYSGKHIQPDIRRVVLAHMRATKTFPGRIRGLVPIGTEVAHKTGSSMTSHGLARSTNDVGIVRLPDGRHFAIAVFLRDSRASEKVRDRTIALAAKAAWDYFSSRK